MSWKLTDFITNWWKRGHTPTSSTSTDSRPTTSSITSESLLTGSESTFWQRLTEICSCRKLARLENELQVERDSRLSLQGQNIAQRGEIDRIAEMLTESLSNERRVYQMQVNVNMQTRYGMVPFPDAPKIPDEIYKSDMKHQIEPDYVNARDLVAQGHKNFREDFMEKNKAHRR